MDDAPLKASEATTDQAGAGPAPAAGAEPPPPDPVLVDPDAPPLSGYLEAILDVRERGQAKTWKQRLVDALLNQAVEGNLRAIQEIWTRLEGKPGAQAAANAAPVAVNDEVRRLILQAGRPADDDDEDDDEDDEESGSED